MPAQPTAYLTSASSFSCHTLLSLIQTSSFLLLPSSLLDTLCFWLSIPCSVCRQQTSACHSSQHHVPHFCCASEHQTLFDVPEWRGEFYASFTHRPPLCLPSLLFVILLTHGWKYFPFMLSLVYAKALGSNLYTAAACGISKVFLQV